jgi:hypothetical protein
VAQHPFPGPGHDDDEPAPGTPARDWAEEDDRYLDWLVAEADAGRIEIPRTNRRPACWSASGRMRTWPGFRARGSPSTKRRT